MRRVKGSIQAVAAVFLSSPAAWAQAPDAALDHFAADENASFALMLGAQCSLSDSIGVVFRSNWQKRHWIKIGGTQVEFNSEAEMSDAGWYQTFEGSEFAVSLQLQRVLPEPQGSDGIRLAGEIVITRSGQSTRYQVTGTCAA